MTSPAPEAHEAALAELPPAAAKEHARHIAQYSTVYDGRGGIKWLDEGGLRCSCGGWDAPVDPVRKMRPWDAWHRHVVASVLLAAGWLPPETVTEARAEAWDEGKSAGLREGKVVTPFHDRFRSVNPYRRADSLAPEAPSEEQR